VDQLEKIQAPTLVLWGDKDTLVTREETDLLLSKVKTATLKVYPNTGMACTGSGPKSSPKTCSPLLLNEGRKTNCNGEPSVERIKMVQESAPPVVVTQERNYGLRRDALSQWGTLAQSLSSIAPTRFARMVIPLVIAVSGPSSWFVYLLATVELP